MSAYSPEIADHLPDWKIKHGEVIYLDVGKVFVLRPFTLGEFKVYAKQREVDEVAAESNLVQTCLLWPENFDVDNLNQADFVTLSEKLLEVSPFDNSQRFRDKLDQARAETDSLHNIIYIHISAAFPAMTIPMIDALPPDYLIHMLSLAEKILQRPVEIEGEKKGPPAPLTPDEVRAANAQAAIAKRDKARGARIERMKQHASGLEAPEISNEPQRLSLMKDMAEMERALGRHPDAQP
jgi:hypothetical protein